MDVNISKSPDIPPWGQLFSISHFYGKDVYGKDAIVLRQQCQLKLCYYRRRQDTDPRLQANCRESETKVKALVSM